MSQIIPYELILEIAKYCDARNLLISKFYYSALIEDIRNNYIYSYPLVRNSNDFEGP